MSDDNGSRHQTSTTKPNFWTTLPGILTGIAAVGTAAAALIGGLTQAGLLHRSTATSATSTSSKAGESSPEQQSTAAKPSTALTDDSRSGSGALAHRIRSDGSTQAGCEQYKILSAQVEDFGFDALTREKTSLLRLHIRVTNEDKYPALFTPMGFRLIVDDVVRAPRDSPSKTVEPGASEDGEVTFVIPSNAKTLRLRVGYSAGEQSEILLQ